MPTYHRSQRLRLVGTGPKVEQLQEGRFRLTFTCTATNPNEAWMNGNKDQIMTAYGTLQSAQKNIAGIDPRTDEAYSDMVLFRTEANPSERDLLITLVYETATGSFVKSQDDKIEIGPNGLQQATRVTIAKTGTTIPTKVVGTALLTVNGITGTLASRSIEENDAFIQITEVYSEIGVEQISEDIVGSQKAIVITKVGAEPTATEAASFSDMGYDSADDWAIAKKDNSRSEGLDVYTYTFLLNNTILSESEDRKGSLKTNVIEVFNPNVTIPGIRVDGGSNIAGDYYQSSSGSFGKKAYIQTTGSYYEKQIYYNGYTGNWQISRYQDTYSTSTDTNPIDSTLPPTTGWSGQGDSELYDFDFTEYDTTLPLSLQGLSTSHRYEKEDYSLINLQKSAVDGIPTMRYTFAKDNSVISVTEDKIGSQNAIVNEIFNPPLTITGVDSDNVALSGYTEADRTESDYEGIKTVRVRFLKNNSILSVSKDKVGSQQSLVVEKFGSQEPTGIIDGISLGTYSVARQEKSNFDGVKTFRYTFLENDTILSRSLDESRADKPEIIEYFKPDASRLSSPPTGKILDKKEESNVDGIPTERYTFRKDGAVLSQNWDKIGSQQAVVITKYNDDPDTPDVEAFTGDSGLTYVIARKVKNGRERTFTFMERNAVLSVSEDKVGSQKAVVNEIFDPTGTISGQDEDGNALVGYSEADRSISNVDGIDTVRVRFLKDDVQLSKSVDNKSSLKTEVQEWFNPGSSRDSKANYELINKQESNVGGIPTERYTFAKPSIMSVTQDFVTNQITVQAFNKSESAVNTALTEVHATNHKLVSQREQDHDGIKTQIYQFEVKSSDLIDFTADDRLQVTRTIFETHNYSYDTNYTVGTTTDNVNSTSVTLTSLRVEERGGSGLMRLTAVYTEPKIISINPILQSEYNSIPMYQYRSIVSSPEAINTTLAALTPAQRLNKPNGTDLNANAIFFEPTVNNTTSPSTFTQNVLDTSIDFSAADASTLISEHQDFYDFLYPGIIGIEIGSLGMENRENIQIKKKSYPITTKVRATVYTFLQKGNTIVQDDYTYNGAQGLWSPNNWGEINVDIYEGFDFVFQKKHHFPSIYNGYRVEGSPRAKFLPVINYYFPRLIYNNMDLGFRGDKFHYNISIPNYGPPDPVSKIWCLGVDIQPAFRDASGTQFYNKEIVITEQIPTIIPNQLNYT